MDDDAVLRETEFYDIDFESKVTEMDGNGNVVVAESQGQLTAGTRNYCPKEPCSRSLRG